MGGHAFPPSMTTEFSLPGTLSTSGTRRRRLSSWDPLKGSPRALPFSSLEAAHSWASRNPSVPGPGTLAANWAFPPNAIVTSNHRGKSPGLGICTGHGPLSKGVIPTLRLVCIITSGRAGLPSSGQLLGPTRSKAVAASMLSSPERYFAHFTTTNRLLIKLSRDEE